VRVRVRTRKKPRARALDEVEVNAYFGRDDVVDVPMPGLGLCRLQCSVGLSLLSDARHHACHDQVLLGSFYDL